MHGVLTFPQMIPDVDDLLAMRPEELAPYVLQLADRHKQNDIVHPQVFNALVDPPPALSPPTYPLHMQEAARQAVAEAWQWLETNGLVVPDHQQITRNGFVRISSAGRKLLSSQDFSTALKAPGLPKSMLHRSIADLIWGDLQRGEWSTASFKAFRAVEEAVRAAGGFSAADLGVKMMRAAFHPTNGPLTDSTQEAGERQGVCDLFAGAMGTYKNAHSHRTVRMVDPAEGYEHVLFASHLLRIVEARAAMRAAPPP